MNVKIPDKKIIDAYHKARKRIRYKSSWVAFDLIHDEFRPMKSKDFRDMMKRFMEKYWDGVNYQFSTASLRREVELYGVRKDRRSPLYFYMRILKNGC